MLAQVLPLALYRPPIDVSSLSIHMVWHPRTHEQAPQRWLRQVFMEVVGAREWD